MMKPSPLLCAVCALIFLVVAYSSSAAIADAVGDEGPGWISALEPSIELDAGIGKVQDCVEQEIDVVNVNRQELEPYSSKTTACVYKGGSIEVVGYYWFKAGNRIQSGMAVKLAGDGFFRHLQDSKVYTYSPLEDVLAYQTGSGTQLVVVKNLSRSIELQHDNSGEPTKYAIKFGAEEKIPKQNGQPAVYNSISHAMSRNGRYVAVYVDYKGVVRIDLATGEEKAILKYAGSWTSGPRNIYPRAVSDDGRFVVLGPNLKVIDTQDCGWDFDGQFNHQNWCEVRDFTQRIKDLVGYEYDISYARFIDESYGVEFETQPMRGVGGSGSAAPKHVTVRVGGVKNRVKLDYLALGDSYSSGEGDTEVTSGKKHYRWGTDSSDPLQEKCHISTRSYPYLLAINQKLETTKWNTIACSGAVIKNDYYNSDYSKYYGQNDRLENLGDAIASYQDAGLHDFTPGRVRQIEFVQKYRPKVITITGSGNDVGFSSILQACVDAFRPDETCTYADDSRGKSKLGREIERQYDNIRKLLAEVKATSPDSEIYYVGYPQFLRETNKTCGLGVSLSQDERKVFRSAVTYLNRVIKAAAESEGAAYVDIEDSLSGHLLCDDKPYVTGYNADCGGGPVNWFKGKNECQESFHPKAAGHALIAQSILKNYPNIMSYRSCVPPANCKKETSLSDIEIPKIFKEAYVQEYNSNTVTVKGGSMLAAQKGNESRQIYATSDYQMQPNTKGRIYLTSDPIELGEAMVDDAGLLMISKPIPDYVPAGYHTLHFEGIAADGKAVELWWIIRIFGRDGDVDEDANPDESDACIFMPVLNIDIDADGIDDGCDSDVDSKSVLTGEIVNKPLGNTAALVSAGVPLRYSHESNEEVKTNKARAHNNAESKEDTASHVANSKTLISILIVTGCIVVFIALRNTIKK